MCSAVHQCSAPCRRVHGVWTSLKAGDASGGRCKARKAAIAILWHTISSLSLRGEEWLRKVQGTGNSCVTGQRQRACPCHI